MDETRLGQVLVNLLLNAAHALAPQKSGHHQVSVRVRPDEKGRVVIEVSDTGCGMSPEVLKRIFEPFFTTKPVGVGTGVGLSICLGIVTAVGGELRAESEVGAGSVFRVILPIAAEKMQEVVCLQPAGAARRRGRILVIDDDDMMRRAIGRILKEHQPVCSESAEAALKRLECGETFDIIFSDLIMPDMTGIELYEELLRTRPECARRVVFLSGDVASSKVADFLASVPNLSVGKPFEPDGLRTIVQQLLALEQGQPAGI
jgi:CheY-like chemotaxis protein